MDTDGVDPFSFEAIASGAVPSSLPFLNSNSHGNSIEDTVTYQIYVPLITSPDLKGGSDRIISDSENHKTENKDGLAERDGIVGSATRTQLAEIKSAALKLVTETPSLKGYIWQKEEFGLDLIWENGTWLLQGKTAVADSVADEWLVVWILVQLSKQFRSAWVRVYDLDGEFLAAEAAEHIPEWLTPDNDSNRIWINDGQVKIIRAEGQDFDKGLEITDALHRVLSTSNLYSTPQLSTAAISRIPSGDSMIRSHLHRSILVIPRRLAWIIHEKPQTVSQAVEAFYLRDPVSLGNFGKGEVKKGPKAGEQERTEDRIAATSTDVNTASPSGIKTRFPVQDLVSCSVLFNRVGFAQLHSQQLSIPAPWADVVNSVRLQAEGPEKIRAMRRIEMSIELTTGYELLLSNPIYGDRRNVQEIDILLEDLEEGDEELPTDDEINAWPFAREEDDEKWMSIDWRDFEAELSGGNATQNAANTSGETTAPMFGPVKPRKDVGDGFGDKGAQENLRRIVERTKAFMEDEDAGLDGFNISSDSDSGSRKKPKPKRMNQMDVKEWLAMSSSDDDDDDADDDDNGNDSDKRNGLYGFGAGQKGELPTQDGAESDAESHTSSVDSEEFDDELRDILKVPPHYLMSAGTGRSAFGPVAPPNFRNIDGRTVIMSEEEFRKEKKRREAASLRRPRNPRDGEDKHREDGDDDDEDDDEDDDDFGLNDPNREDLTDGGDIHPDSKYHQFVENARERMKKRNVHVSLDLPEDDLIREELDRDQIERARERELIRQRLKESRAAFERGEYQQKSGTVGAPGPSGATVGDISLSPLAHVGVSRAIGTIVEGEEGENGADDDDVVALSQQFESELKAAGALKLSSDIPMRSVFGHDGKDNNKPMSSGNRISSRSKGARRRGPSSRIQEVSAHYQAGESVLPPMPPLLDDDHDSNSKGEVEGRGNETSSRRGLVSMGRKGKESEGPGKVVQEHEYYGPDGDGNHDDDDEDGDVQIAANLLAALQSYPGAPGPASNLLGMLGLHTPVPEPENSDR